jgi:hypothetical protein
MRRLLLPLLLTLALVACAPTQTAPLQTDPQPASASSDSSQTDAGDLTRTDQQGAIVVEVKPLNLDNPSDQLEFDVVMDTHSVDLSMDLATLATLTTDTGVTVQAAAWDAPRGGHHVEGKLTFPAVKDGKSILEGASKLTLTIVDVDAPSRIFDWALQ